MSITDRLKAARLRREQRARRAERRQAEESARQLDDGATTAVAERPPASPFDRAVPWPMQIAGAWAWRLIAVAIAVYGLSLILQYLSEVAVPVAIAVLLAAAFYPVSTRLQKWGLPLVWSVALALIAGVLLVAGVLSVITAVIAGGYEELVTSATAGIQQLVDWLDSGPLHINGDQINEAINNVGQWVLDSKATIATYAADIGSKVGHFFAGLALMIFSLFYFLYDGRRIWTFLLNFLPRAARQRTDVAARHGWNSLVHYVRATVLVAAVDAIGTLAGALILGVPLAPALAALVFLGAFIPLVGAFVSGTVAVAVALVTLGWVKAVIMLAVIVGVMFVEGHFLQPFLLGRAVALHPLAVLLGIAVGIIVGGIVGGLVVIPILAFGKTFVQSLASRDGSLPLPVKPAHGH